MTGDAAPRPPRQPQAPGLCPELRRRLLDVLVAELALACREALDRGVAPPELAARLRAHAATLRATTRPSSP